MLALRAWIGAVADRRWTALQVRITALVEEAKTRDPRRPVLRGTAVPGNAWEDYRRAIDAAKMLARNMILSEFVSRSPKADPDQARSIVNANLAALEGLQAGAARAEGAWALDWDRGLDADRHDGFKCSPLMTLAVARARFLREDGHPGEARDLLLDALQFAGDFGRNAPLFVALGSTLLMDPPLSELATSLPDPGVVGALSVLDRAFPFGAESFLNEAALVGASLRKPESGVMNVLTDDPIIVLGTWRYGFSTRLFFANAAETHLAAMRRSAASFPTSWSEHKRIAWARHIEFMEGSNLVARVLTRSPDLYDRRVFECQARIRLLRRYHGETAELDDPFGGKIRDDGRKIWSIGADGKDDGGIAPADLVLERPRR